MKPLGVETASALCVKDQEPHEEGRRRTGPETAKPYEPTPQEQAVLDAARARRKEMPPSPSMKLVEKGDVPQLDIDHPDLGVATDLLMEALGTTDIHFFSGLLLQLANAGSQGKKVDERGLNFMLSVVKGIQPKDQIEAMLASQMAAVHMATMTFARRLDHVDNIPQQDSAERTFNKLARTFATQVEALKRYRTGGGQVVRVEHVNVHAGGQAVVGNVTHTGGGGAEKTGEQPHATWTCTRRRDAEQDRSGPGSRADRQRSAVRPSAGCTAPAAARRRQQERPQARSL